VTDRSARDAADLWPLVFDPDAAPLGSDAAALRPAAERLSALVSPALAKFLLAPYERHTGATLVAEDRANQSRLLNRLAAAHQARWVAEIAAADIEIVCLKGYANARLFYPDPDLRSTGDLDLLVRPADLGRLVALLEGRGFRFDTVPLPRWGFISDASFIPFVAPDGACNIDIHVRPDSYPAHRSVTTELVFDGARRVAGRDGPFCAPAPEHALALAITNAAKDKFGPFAALKLIDAARLIRATPSLDWDAVEGLARRGHFLRPARVFISLLAALGFPASLLPAGLARPPIGVAGGEFARLVGAWRGLVAEAPRAGQVLRREIMLCTEPRVGLHNAWLRLRGLARPGRGVPSLAGRP